MMERGFDLIEHLVQPPVDQFLKCVVYLSTYKWDEMEGPRRKGTGLAPTRVCMH